MKDKFNLTQEQNIFLAKRNIIDAIWKSANLEGIAITFPETQKIYEGGNIEHLRLDEIVTINNLKHAWQFILNSIDDEIDFNYISSVHSLVGSNLVDSPGKIRVYEVKMAGTEWIPELPTKENLEKSHLRDRQVRFIAISENNKVEFGTKLIAYYENEDKLEDLIQFIYEKCLDGIDEKR